MNKPRRIQITHIHEKDRFYGCKEWYIGKTGLFTPEKSLCCPGYFYGRFIPDDTERNAVTFLGVRYKKI